MAKIWLAEFDLAPLKKTQTTNILLKFSSVTQSLATTAFASTLMSLVSMNDDTVEYAPKQWNYVGETMCQSDAAYGLPRRYNMYIVHGVFPSYILFELFACIYLGEFIFPLHRPSYGFPRPGPFLFTSPLHSPFSHFRNKPTNVQTNEPRSVAFFTPKVSFWP